MTSEKGIIKDIKESIESLYNHCNKFEHVHNMFSNLLVTHEKQERDRIEKEFNEKEKGLQEAFLLKKEELKNTYNRNTKNEKLHYEKTMNEINDNLAQMEKEHRAEWLSWDNAFWRQFTPIKSINEPPLTRFGELELKTKDKNNTKTIPALLRLITSKNLIINASDNDKNAAIVALQSIMLRLLVTIPPGKVNFILIDPVGLGSNMAGFMHLPEELVGGKIWTEPNHIEQQLVDLSTHMETIIQKYLRNNFPTMEEYNKEAGEVAEPYRFLVITNFPANFTEAAAQRLISIASNGPKTGVYVLIMRDTALKLPYNFVIEELERLSAIIECENGRFVWNGDNFKDLRLVLDGLPSTKLFDSLLKSIGEESKLASVVQVPFEMALKEIKNWWGLKSDEGLSTPIGRAGARRLQYFSLGKGTLQHVLIGGKTGSGKSNLLHTIILSLCISYSPDELELYLIDFKKGIEFKSYATKELPHAKVIAIQSEREFGLSVLQGLDAELQRRGDLFRSAGVQNLKEFRLKNGFANMHRILLLVDEFQEFFTEDDAIASQSALLFDRLVRQGRAFGMHVILASQALAGTYTISRSTTDQMAIRIALQCSYADSRLILGEDNPTARLLSRPGEAIYNDANGLIEGNTLFQILYLSDQDREKYLKELNNLYKIQKPDAELHQIIFEGNAPANIERNKILSELINAPDWCSDLSQLQAWLGEPIAIKAHTAAVFKRQSRSNLMVIGQNEESGSAMLVSALIGLAAQRPPDSIEFHILDLSNTDSPWNKIINSLPKYFNHKIALYTKRHVNDAIEALFSILKEREASESGHTERSIFFFVFGLPRAKELKSSDGYTYPDPTNNLFSLLSNGPDFGIHTICLGDTFKNIEKILGRNISEFDFRVAMQMSINESNELIDSPDANKLGQYRALFYDEEKTGKLEKFRPYALQSSEWLGFMSNKLKNRAKKANI